MPDQHLIHDDVSGDARSVAVDSYSPGEYRQYLARHMRPMIRALMLAAVLVYGIGVSASSLLQVTPQQLPLWLRLAPMVPLLMVAVATHFSRRPWVLSALTLSCVLLLQIGFNLNSIGHIQGQPHVIPGLLLPVVCSIVWLTGWDFAVAMTLCALGPLPMLLLGPTDSVQIIQYSVYMAIAIAMASVLRSFMARTLLAQFRLERQLRAQIHTDGLTGLLRRNRFLELAQQAIDDARNQRRPLCLIFLDVDHFKPLNDSYGHAAGDTALMALASALRSQTRQHDLIGRIGGEEFALLLPGMDLGKAALRAEQLRTSAHTVYRPDGRLTISIGLAEYAPDHDDIASLMARADQAMRHAKSGGRDRVVTAAND
ncbi:MAG: GGDEF domain-containing protein [Rhodanobacter sp.]